MAVVTVQQPGEPSRRMLPELTRETAPFWAGGADGLLLIARCQDCRHWIHPPMPVCSVCLSRDVVPTPVSGFAIVHSFTINHQPFLPDVPVPFAIAIVELPEQTGLRLTTNIVGCAPEDVHIGMRVTVQFEQHADIFIPLFRPA